jgi:hypothetical protein
MKEEEGGNKINKIINKIMLRLLMCHTVETMLGFAG